MSAHTVNGFLSETTFRKRTNWLSRIAKVIMLSAETNIQKVGLFQYEYEIEYEIIYKIG